MKLLKKVKCLIGYHDLTIMDGESDGPFSVESDLYPINYIFHRHVCNNCKYQKFVLTGERKNDSKENQNKEN